MERKNSKPNALAASQRSGKAYVSEPEKALSLLFSGEKSQVTILRDTGALVLESVLHYQQFGICVFAALLTIEGSALLLQLDQYSYWQRRPYPYTIGPFTKLLFKTMLCSGTFIVPSSCGTCLIVHPSSWPVIFNKGGSYNNQNKWCPITGIVNCCACILGKGGLKSMVRLFNFLLDFLPSAHFNLEAKGQVVGSSLQIICFSLPTSGGVWGIKCTTVGRLYRLFQVHTSLIIHLQVSSGCESGGVSSKGLLKFLWLYRILEPS